VAILDIPAIAMVGREDTVRLMVGMDDWSSMDIMSDILPTILSITPNASMLIELDMEAGVVVATPLVAAVSRPRPGPASRIYSGRHSTLPSPFASMLSTQFG
jgi:hypothetical protein